MPEPELWWPHSLGDQPLHDLRCEVVVDGEVSDSHETRVGFRSVRMRNWVLRINGERLFVKGIGMLPTSARPGDASAVEVAGDVLAAKRAGLDMIRVITHIARPEVYETADEVGMLLWQDLPLRGQMARSVRGQATRQAREAVDLLGHHPSVAVWCAHDEPFKKPDAPAPTPPFVGPTNALMEPHRAGPFGAPSAHSHRWFPSGGGAHRGAANLSRLRRHYQQSLVRLAPWQSIGSCRRRGTDPTDGQVRNRIWSRHC